MYRALVIRAGWISLCLLTFATVSLSQPAPIAEPSPTPQQIVYTGSLFGYFRVPDLQSGTLVRQSDGQIQRCQPNPEENGSRAATAFLTKLRKAKEAHKLDGDAILVGTGDNFAPRLEARMFAPAPGDADRKADWYAPGNKELYFADGDKWIFYKHINDKDKKDLRDRLAAGLGTIPTDNVGCFLAAAGYAAVVPGKHDFYFGPERVRELARFMASLPSKETPGDYHQVHMLGANLVIKTERLDGASLPKSSRTSWKWPEGLSVSNLQDKKTVYPWFANVHVKMMDFNPESGVPGLLIDALAREKTPATENRFVQILNQIIAGVPPTSDDHEKLSKLIKSAQELEKSSVYVCASSADPNDITPNEGCKLKEENRTIHVSHNAVIYDLALDPDREGRFSAVTAGRNYALILGDPNEKRNCSDEKLPCIRFSVHRPFFYYPNSSPESGDPDPYVLLKKENAAIFGVVDRTIGEQVGVLNFAWLNQDDKLKTIVSAEDPVEALQQQLESFDRRHPGFTGLKILLAQMSPPLARVLASHFPELQVVVTAANQEQATSDTAYGTLWSPNSGASAGSFVAVPSPYFDLKQGNDVEGTLHFGSIKAKNVAENEWSLSATKSATKSMPPLPVLKDPSKPVEAFTKLVDKSLDKCLSADPASKKPDALFDRVKWLTLCAMRDQTGADVALIQKRDFYNELGAIGQDPKDPVQAQAMLDRIIWKGDLLTLLYLPGSALKKVLDQSTKFDNEDTNALSLADEGLRGLEYLGVRKTEKEYLVNEVPVDDKKLYAVATTDYIAAGDTGYPDLAAALNQERRPTQFPEQLKTISGIVCGELNPNNRFERCLNEITRDDYLDASVAEIEAPSQPSFGSRLWKLFPYKLPSKDSPPKPTSALEQQAQHHPIWSLALRSFSLGFLSLSNNLSDAQLGAKFAAVSTSGVTAKKTHTVTVGLDTRLTRSSHLNEFFVAMGIDYSELSTGDVTPSVSRLKNRVAGDASFIRSLRGGRSKDRVGIAFALHAETPLQQPFATFTLGTKDTLKITQNRSVLLLPRIGMRWQNGDNFFEVGGQAGREIQAFSGYRFNTQGSIVECLPSATQTFAACITEKSTAPATAITKNSVATAILRNRLRAGLYWKYGLSIPFGSKVKYDINQEGNQEADFFFNFHEDNSADTRFLDRSKHSLKFTIWPSFSIGPSLQFLLYRNKVNHDFLFQKQFGFEANFSFNLSNHREKEVQIKYK